MDVSDPDLDDLIATLDRVEALARWEQSLTRLLDRIDRPCPPAPKWPRPDGLGIDLAKHYRDIRNLVIKYGFPSCAANNWDFNDLLQNILMKIAKANVGAHPYDPSRGALSTYVWQATASIVNNMWRKGSGARAVDTDDRGHRAHAPGPSTWRADVGDRVRDTVSRMENLPARTREAVEQGHRHRL